MYAKIFHALKGAILVFFCFFFSLTLWSQSSEEWLQKGWKKLIQDKDTLAIKFFNQAYEKAVMERDNRLQAEALLNIGIASYGTSLSNGLKYARKALLKFEKLDPKNAAIGRGKCLLLFGTIKAREKKFQETIALGNEAIVLLQKYRDTSESLGLGYGLLGSAFLQLNQIDSSDYYFEKSHQQCILRNDRIYLPGSYYRMGKIALRKQDAPSSWVLFSKAHTIAIQTKNRQSQVLAILGKASWQLEMKSNYTESEILLKEAKKIAQTISDKSFLVATLLQQKELFKVQKKYEKALELEEMITHLKDSIAQVDKVHLTKSLEVQFGLSEKERELKLAKNEKAIANLTNYLLIGIIVFGGIIGLGIILFLRRINKRNQQLYDAKAALLQLEEEKKRLKEQQLKNEIEFKESQMSALTFQMLQKNELLQELKEKLDSISDSNPDTSLSKIINRGLNQDKEWSDFNKHFEAINKNFYSRIKQTFPDISPNELKICALIKMNLSSKEMAAILNISADSVKTARYRLRKKLNLNYEDNLTDFILNL